MARQLLDLSYAVFERLTVVKEDSRRVSKGRTRRYWLCSCSCGNSVVIEQTQLRTGRTKSCGCLQKERARDTNTLHGLRFSKYYNSYHHMLERSKGRSNCKVMFTLEGWIDYCKVESHGWFEGCCVCRSGDAGDYKVGNIRFDTKQSNTEEALAKHYTLLNPEGEVVEVYNMRKFCRANNLSSSSMVKVTKGKQKHHKQWRKV